MSHLTTSEGCGIGSEEFYTLIKKVDINAFFFPPVLISAMCVQVTTEWLGLKHHIKAKSSIQKSLTLVQVSAI